MARFLLTAALILTLPGTALADDGGMAAPGGNTGDVAAPAEPAPVPVEAPPTDPSIGDDIVPPADIGPYGPNHAPVAPASTTPAPGPTGSSEDTSSAGAAVHEWPHAQTRAAEITSPSGLVGADGPGTSSRVVDGGAPPPWIFGALALALALAIAVVLASLRAGSQAAARRSAPQSLHRFA